MSQESLTKLSAERRQYLEAYRYCGVKPPLPTVLLDGGVIGIKDAFSGLRTQFLLPWLLGIFYSLFWLGSEFYSDWKAMESSYVRMVESRQKYQGIDYFDEAPNPVDLKRYQRLNERGELPLSVYVYVRYNDTAFPERALKGDIIFGGGAVLSALLLIFCILIATAKLFIRGGLVGQWLSTMMRLGIP